MPGERIKQRQAFHFFIKQLDAQRHVIRLRREDVNHFTTHTERPALEGLVVTGVLQFRQTTQNIALIDDHADGQVQHHFQIQVRIAQAVNCRHGSHHHHITTLQQRFSRRQTHLLNVFVDRRVFLNKRIGTGNVRFRLIIVVVGDEILHGIVRKELLHFAIQLRCQRFIRCQHHGRTLKIGDNIGNGKRLP